MAPEWLVDHHQDQDQRILSMALLRYYFNDAASVNSLLQSIPASSAYSSDVAVMQGLLRLQSGSKPPYHQLTAKDPPIRSQVLKDWKRKLDE